MCLTFDFKYFATFDIFDGFVALAEILMVVVDDIFILYFLVFMYFNL